MAQRICVQRGTGELYVQRGTDELYVQCGTDELHMQCGTEELYVQCDTEELFTYSVAQRTCTYSVTQRNLSTVWHRGTVPTVWHRGTRQIHRQIETHSLRVVSARRRSPPLHVVENTHVRNTQYIFVTGPESSVTVSNHSRHSKLCFSQFVYLFILLNPISAHLNIITKLYLYQYRDTCVFIIPCPQCV